MGWSPYVESEAVSPVEGVTEGSLFEAKLLDSLAAIHLQLKLLNARFEEASETRITEKDV